MADQYEFVWWERLYELCFLLYEKIMESGYNPDVIIGVARGGWVPARVLSDLFFMPDTANVKVDLYRGIYARNERPRVSQSIPDDMQWENPLVVDDISDSGDSLKAALEHLDGRGLKNIRTACVHMKPWTSLVPNFYVVQTEAWVIYPWEMKEFTFDFANQLAEQKIAPAEIKNRLLQLGIPMHYAGYFLKQWQTVDGHRTRGKEPRRDE